MAKHAGSVPNTTLLPLPEINCSTYLSNRYGGIYIDLVVCDLCITVWSNYSPNLRPTALLTGKIGRLKSMPYAYGAFSSTLIWNWVYRMETIEM